MLRNLFSIRIYLALIVVVSSLTGTSVLAQGATVVRIDPSTQSVQVNGRVDIPVKVENISNFTAFEIHLSFDPAVLEVTEVTNGGFIAADFIVQDVFDNTAGTIDYAVAQMNNTPAQGNGVLLNIAFRAKAKGNSTVTLRSTQAAPTGLLLSDQNGIAIQAVWVAGNVVVGSELPSVTSTGISPTPVTPTVISPTPVTPTVKSPTPITSTAVSQTPVTLTVVSPTTVTVTATNPQSAAAVRIDPAAISLNINDTFNLFVKVDNAVNLSAFEIHLSFNAATLEVKELINGGFVVADVVAQNTFNNSTGTVDYAVAQKARTPSSGNGILLTIVFRAKSAGTYPVTLRSVQTASTGLLLSDLNGALLPANWTPGSVTVKSNDTQPRIHVVRLGEWLYCIGRAYNASPQAVIEANGLWWPYIIFPGQQLVIPNVTWVGMSAGPVCQPQFASPILPVFSSTALPATIIPVTIVPTTIAATAGVLASVTPIPSSACRAVHVVVPGDTLYRIGVSYGISYTEIARVNQISNARLIYSGQRLCIP